MATTFDYDALRAQTMGAGNDEAVTVNTRALIDKVLARYSGEWTTLRELIQNAADASATKVVIRFQTLPSTSVPVPQSSDPSARLRHVLLHHTVKCLYVENNGTPFRDSDWSRLKKIAEGNPDETKIGAFGVGFYSVFAECEQPFVSSGMEALAFYWKGDSLFTRRLHMGNVQSNNTTFVLPMRNLSSPVPSLLSLCQFLASSLTFVGLESIDLWLDDWKVLDLHKIIAPSVDINIPRDVDKTTSEGLMQVKNITQEAFQLNARWLKAVEWKPKATPAITKSTQHSMSKTSPAGQSLRMFFSKLAPGSNNAAVEKEAKEEIVMQNAISEDLLIESNATLFIHVNKANVVPLVKIDFAKELERATKKPPPRATTVSLLTASFDEHVASRSAMVDALKSGTDIFSSVLPTRGRIFIGFPTNQTTGLNAHLSMPSIIPTVERESIDLNNRFVRTWNKELLRIAGIVARVAWTSEMADLRAKLSSKILIAAKHYPSKEDIEKLLPETLFLHKTFTFAESTPISEVVNLVEESFWTCNRKVSIDILSSRGVLPSSSVRVSTENLGFVQDIPVIPDALKEIGLIKKLRDYGVITEITIPDIRKELSGKALGSEQLQRFLQWLGDKARAGDIDRDTVQSLLAVAVATDEETNKSRILVLGDIKNYINVQKVPQEMPIPPTTIPFKFTKKMSKMDLEALGWQDLHTVPWLTYLMDNIGSRGDLSSDQDLTTSQSFARAVLPVISKQWDGLTQAHKTSVIELLTPQTIMPTKLGMRRPGDSYFPSVNLFEDLPVIVSIQGVKEKLLVALGVRKTIDIGVVFERLMAPSLKPSVQVDRAAKKWSHVDLIKYLSSVRNDIPLKDIKRLRETPICPAESEPLGNSTKLYLISELFEPDEVLRRLKLPILHWPGIFRPGSPEGRFLNFLGLRSAPNYMELVNIMSAASLAKNGSLRDCALRYFIDNHHTKGYANFDHSIVTVPYLPLEGEAKLSTPIQCFANERAALLGYSILRKDLHVHASKFGVNNDPPIQDCINRLVQKPPQFKRDAREVFEYFAGRLNEIDRQHSDMLGGAAIVPVTVKSASLEKPGSETVEGLRHIPPRACFLGFDDRYAEIFDYVDFGQEANAFLIRCGSKHEPSTAELAMLVVRQPAKLFAVLELPRYLQLLRNLAEAWQNLKKNKDLAKTMKTAKFLLAYRDYPSSSLNSNHEEDDDQFVRVAELASASQIVIMDDFITFNQFKTSLLAAPMEQALEDFYFSLGTPELGSLVEENHNIAPPTRDQSIALKLQKLVQERMPLYLHDIQPELIKRDANWMEKHLSVICVNSISLRKSLRGHPGSHNESRSAAQKASLKGYNLYITAKYDYFEVSQVLVPLLLNRSKTQHIMMLEMMLATPLNKLQARGYNVQRILRQKAAEARIAEATRVANLEKEAAELKAREAEYNAQESQRSSDSQPGKSMPGVFPDYPDRSDQLTAPEVPQKPRGFFSDIGKRLGIESGSHPLLQERPSQNNMNGKLMIPNQDAPPRYTQNNHSVHVQPETVTAPHQLQQNLVNAIKASRAHNSTSVVSQPAVHEVKETKSYCDARNSQDISYVGTIANIRIFISRTATENLNLSGPQFLSSSAPGLNLFAHVLMDCADIFLLDRKSLHIFYDDRGSTIAFNQNKSLFFNYRYFENLHLKQMEKGQTGDAVVYWFVVMAHELAHNLVEDHSANHSYYTEALVIQYFTKVAGKIAASKGSEAASKITPLLNDIDQINHYIKELV